MFGYGNFSMPKTYMTNGIVGKIRDRSFKKKIEKAKLYLENFLDAYSQFENNVGRMVGEYKQKVRMYENQLNEYFKNNRMNEARLTVKRIKMFQSAANGLEDLLTKVSYIKGEIEMQLDALVLIEDLRLVGPLLANLLKVKDTMKVFEKYGISIGTLDRYLTKAIKELSRGPMIDLKVNMQDIQLTPEEEKLFSQYWQQYRSKELEAKERDAKLEELERRISEEAR